MKLAIWRYYAILHFINGIVCLSSINVPIENIIMPDGCSESRRSDLIKELTRNTLDDPSVSKPYGRELGYSSFNPGFGSFADNSIRCLPQGISDPYTGQSIGMASFDPCRSFNKNQIQQPLPQIQQPLSQIIPQIQQPLPQIIPQIQQQLPQIIPQIQQPLPQIIQPSISTSTVRVPVTVMKTVTVTEAPSYQQLPSTMAQPSIIPSPAISPSLFGGGSMVQNGCNSFKASSYCGGNINCGQTILNKPRQAQNVQPMPYQQYNMQNSCPPDVIPCNQGDCASSAPLKVHSLKKRNKRSNRQKNDRVKIECDCRIIPSGLEDCNCDKKK